MQKEIGSEFWDIPLSDKRNHLFDNATWFISGRAAFRAILEQIPLDTGVTSLKVALPSYLCESMIAPLDIEEIEYKFYSVFLKNGAIQYDYTDVYDCNVVLVIDYFGYKTALNGFPKSSAQIIVRDLTHSLFVQKYNDADYYFGSLRKWAGFCGAGFAFKKNGSLIKPNIAPDEFIVSKTKAIELKKQYINGEINSKSEFQQLFHNAEEMLDDCEIAFCGLNDIHSAEHLDIDFIKRKRRENAEVLINGLTDYCICAYLGPNDCPLCVPILIKNRDALRNKLISEKIYLPIHWPKPEQVKNNVSDELYKQELSLVCDQRYTKEDMFRIIKTIKTFLENDTDA